MPNTPNFSLPYPSPGAVTNVPGDIEALADAVDDLILLRPPQAKIYGANGQYIGNGGSYPFSTVQFNATTYEDNGITVSYPGIVLPYSGLYTITACVRWNLFSIAAANVDLLLYNNHAGGSIGLIGRSESVGTTGALTQSFSTEARGSAGDTLSIVVYQDSSATQTLASVPSNFAPDSFNYFTVSLRSF